MKLIIIIFPVCEALHADTTLLDDDFLDDIPNIESSPKKSWKNAHRESVTDISVSFEIDDMTSRLYSISV
jgi:hypothetical protein